MNRDVAGIILAGGRSSRMGGGDKCLMPLAGRPLLAHVAERLSPQVATLALNANGDPRRFSGFGLQVVPDDAAGHAGPLAGVLAGMRWARRQAGFTHIATVAADTPFLPRNLVAGLAAIDELTGGRIVLSRSAGRTHPVFGLWPVALAPDLARFMEETDTYRMTAYAGARHEAAYADFALANGLDPFFNVNTPEDLAVAGELMKDQGP